MRTASVKQSLLFKQLKTSGGWKCVAPPNSPSRDIILAASHIIIFCRLWSVFQLQVYIWTANVLHADDKNVSRKVVYKKKKHYRGGNFFFNSAKDALAILRFLIKIEPIGVYFWLESSFISSSTADYFTFGTFSH